MPEFLPDFSVAKVLALRLMGEFLSCVANGLWGRVKQELSAAPFLWCEWSLKVEEVVVIASDEA